jgi:hypothetical protein
MDDMNRYRIVPHQHLVDNELKFVVQQQNDYSRYSTEYHPFWPFGKKEVVERVPYWSRLNDGDDYIYFVSVEDAKVFIDQRVKTEERLVDHIAIPPEEYP